MSIKGKVALVTASASGIGKASALALAGGGANVIVCDINEEAIAETTEEIKALGVETIGIRCDMSNIKDIDKMFDEAIKKFGTIDILVNNAGIAGPTQSIIDMEPEDWDLCLNINLRAQYYCIKKAAPYMIKAGKGKIVNMSSQSGKKALPNRSPYCASKMGVIGLTRCVAAELGKHNITVNAICPGPVSGPRMDKVFEGISKIENISVEKAEENFLADADLKRLVPPEDIAKMVVILSDEELSNSITAQDINVNVGIIPN